jgi:hypothetical protein
MFDGRFESVVAMCFEDLPGSMMEAFEVQFKTVPTQDSKTSLERMDWEKFNIFH